MNRKIKRFCDACKKWQKLMIPEGTVCTTCPKCGKAIILKKLK